MGFIPIGLAITSRKGSNRLNTCKQPIVTTSLTDLPLSHSIDFKREFTNHSISPPTNAQ